MLDKKNHFFPRIIRREELKVESPAEGMTGFLFEGQDDNLILFS